MLKVLYIYLISQTINNDYDTYDSAIVIAESEEAARMFHPNGTIWNPKDNRHRTWAYKPEQVQVVKIGVADEGQQPGVVLASFNAG